MEKIRASMEPFWDLEIIVTVSDKTRHMGSVRYSRNSTFLVCQVKKYQSSFCHVHVKEPFY
jgi:hypothetical protein